MNLFKKKRPPEGKDPVSPPIAPVYAAPEVLSGPRLAPRPAPDYPQNFAVPEPPRYVCPACGAFVEPHFNFCPICGVRLTELRKWEKPQPAPPDPLTATVYAAPDFWDKKD